MINKFMPRGFRLGELVACVQQKGIYHKDMKIDNMGFRNNGDITFLDFSDIEPFEYPAAFNVDKMSKCLMPIIRERTFDQVALFRLGYICAGGEISEIVFKNLYRSMNISSFDFWYNKTPPHCPDQKYCFDIEDADEWRTEDVVNNIFMKWMTLDEYEKNDFRKTLSVLNKYYLDKYFLTVYFYFFKAQNKYEEMAIILINLGMRELAAHYYTASYILLHLAEKFIQKQRNIPESQLYFIRGKKEESRRRSNYKESFLNDVLNCIEEKKFDLACIDWLIYDLEHFELEEGIK